MLQLISTSKQSTEEKNIKGCVQIFQAWHWFTELLFAIDKQDYVLSMQF